MRSHLLGTALSLILIFSSGCGVWVNSPYDPDDNDTTSVPGDTTGGTVHPPQQTYSAATFFPFEDVTKRWYYTSSASSLVISVLDTISDDVEHYFKISFAEQGVDTTIDWFRRTANGVEFCEGLTYCTYTVFLPATVNGAGGSFTGRTGSVAYDFYDSLSVGGTLFHRVIRLRYASALLHGFDEIYFADSIGIVRFYDKDNRIPLYYDLDSTVANTTVREF